MQMQPVVMPESFLYMESFARGKWHTGYYRSVSVGSYQKRLSPKVFESPLLAPLDETIPCAAIKGQSLREKEQQELDDWSKAELKKWRICKEGVKEESPVVQGQGELPSLRLLKERNRDPEGGASGNTESPKATQNKPPTRRGIQEAIQAAGRNFDQ
ncbi:MAG TPA: hypothetical protein VFA15_08935 [Nitrososphaera sp.]|nr:hypothetical protein [Nitrososphaera sp.]